MVMVLGIKEYQEKLAKFFKDIQISIYSEIDIKGFKAENSLSDSNNWFASDMEPDFSMLAFAFVSEQGANAILKGIKNLNEQDDCNCPFHVFQMPVEKFV